MISLWIFLHVYNCCHTKWTATFFGIKEGVFPIQKVNNGLNQMTFFFFFSL